MLPEEAEEALQREEGLMLSKLRLIQLPSLSLFNLFNLSLPFLILFFSAAQFLYLFLLLPAHLDDTFWLRLSAGIHIHVHLHTSHVISSSPFTSY